MKAALSPCLQAFLIHDCVDGTGWPPYISNSSSIDVFDKLWCRSIHLTQATSLNVSNDLPSNNNTADDDLNAKIYVQSDGVYNNTDYDRGFCIGDNEQCMAHGVIDVSRCRG
jgi:CD36 family